MKCYDLPLLSARIDARLAALGYKAKGLLIAKGVHEDKIRRIKSGTSPTLDSLEEVAGALGWSVGQLLGYEPIDETVTAGPMASDLDETKVAMALRIVRAILSHMPLVPEPVQSDLEASLVAEAYGILSDLEADGISPEQREATASRMLKRAAKSAALARDARVS